MEFVVIATGWLYVRDAVMYGLKTFTLRALDCFRSYRQVCRDIKVADIEFMVSECFQHKGSTL